MRRKSFGTWAALLSLAVVLALSGSPAWALRFVVYGDSAGSEPGQAVNEAVLAEINAQVVALSPKPSFVVFLGDMARTGGRADGGVNYGLWQEAMKPLREASIHVYPVIGNRELTQENVQDALHRRLQTEYQKFFSGVPHDGPKGYEGLAYTFEDRSTESLFVVLDTYYIPETAEQIDYVRNGRIAPAQMEWLEGKLANSKARHRFVFAHSPAFNPWEKEQPCAETYCALWSLLEEQRVKFYFAGHVHAYSRKNVDSSLFPQARATIVQVIAGTSGSKPDDPARIGADESWRMKGVFNYAVVDVNPDGILVTAYGKTGEGFEIIDMFSVKDQ